MFSADVWMARKRVTQSSVGEAPFCADEGPQRVER